MLNRQQLVSWLFLGIALFLHTACMEPLQVRPGLDLSAYYILSANLTRVTSSQASFKRIFENSGPTNGGFGGIAGGDAICNASAQRPDTTKTYKALLSAPGVRVACTSANCGPGNGPAEHVDWVFQANTAYYQANGTRMVVTNSDAIFSSLESALPGGGSFTWTGLGSNWIGGNYCFNGGPWLDTSAGINGIYGDNDQTTSAFFSTATLACSSNAVLVCVEQ